MSPLSLSQQFPSLTIPLQTYRIVGLYFASSWCPDCSPVTPQLKKFYSKALMLQAGTSEVKKNFEVVYVSSDMNAKQMEEYYKTEHAAWSFVPYSHSDELMAMKRFFQVCAGKEAPGLGMSGPGARLSGIPTLLLLDSENERILSRDGVQDIMRLSVEEALHKWDTTLAL